jgi:antitoxin (DNA-binding transcriptional repressor) of toxin-antitoxin stability system
MKRVSVRDLRYDFKAVESLLGRGEEVQITKRRRVIARLIPEPARPSSLPDFLERLKATYGETVLDVSGAEIVRLDRER